MLSRIRIENFKALRNLDLLLRDRNVFIGPNKSGKSSILHSLGYLARSIATGDATNYFGGAIGFQQYLWKGIAKGTIKIEICGDDRPLFDEGLMPLEFSYSLEIGPDAVGNIVILSERLTVTHEGKRRPLIESSLGVGKALRLDGTSIFQNPESKVKPFLSYEVPGWEADRIRKYISTWNFFSLMSELPKLQATPAAAQNFLDTQGGQLSSWLHTFKSNFPESFKQVIAVAKEAFPEIESVSLPLTQAGTTFVSITEKGLASPISIFQASDGEVRFLQLLSIIFMPFPVPLVAIEEPEDRLHPRLLELLVQTADRVRIEEGSQAPQVFATTHSPYLIDLLQPEDVVVVEKRDGSTHCTRAEDKSDLRKLLEDGELGFGRLWYSGALGGV